MSGGYSRSGELPLVLRSEDGEVEPMHSQGPAHPSRVHQQLGFGLDTMVAFGKRSSSFYQTLQAIAHYLPKDGPSAREAMQLVTEQRIWMFDVGCAVGSVVGTCYQLEYNTLQELSRLWRTGNHPDISPKMQKKNFRSTLENLQDRREDRKLALEKIEECEKLATKMVTWHGQEQKMQHAVMQVIAKFGGSAQCEAFLNELKANQEALTSARDAERAAAAKLAEISGQKAELQCQKLVYEGIANNESGTLEKLQSRAKELDKVAAEKAEEAAKTLNIEYKKRGFFGGWYTDWVDNQGDCAAWRSQRFKEIAKSAKAEEGDQAERAKKASSEVAALKGKLAHVEKNMDAALKGLADASKETIAAEAELLKTRDRCRELRKEFGYLDLHQIAALRDHMQKFPELLGASGTKDASMFACMKGELRHHEMLCKRFAVFLDEEDDNECGRLLNSMRYEILSAIENAKFFADELGPLQKQMSQRLAAIKRPEAVAIEQAPTPSRASSGAPADVPSPSPEQPLRLTLAELEDEELF